MRKDARYVRFEALRGDLLRFLGEAIDPGCSSPTILGADLDGVPTALDGSGTRDGLLEGVRIVDEGVKRSKRPNTRPFFWGVGPINLRCATVVACEEPGSDCRTVFLV